MANEGYIKLYRRVRDNWIWQDPEKLKAWLDLLLSATHKEIKVRSDESLIILCRGSLLTSIRELSLRWNWGRTKTKNFLDQLQADGMISQKRATKRATAQTIIIINNFDLFQSANKPQDVPQTSHRRATDEPHNKNDKNDKECNNNITRARANKFHNFVQRDDDYSDIMQTLYEDL